MRLFRRNLTARTAAPAVPLPAPPGRVRRWLVPSAVFTGLVGVLACGAYALLVAYQPERLALDHREPLSTLQQWLPGEVLDVPEAPGLWAAELRGNRLLLARAVSDGPAQTVNLCHQVWGGQDDPSSLYPVALVAGLPGPGADKGLRHRTARQPIVLASALGAGLPMVWVQGRQADGAQPAELQLRVVPAANEETESWKVGLARPVSNARGATGHTFALEHEAWLLWTPEPVTDTVNASTSSQALAGTSPRYRWGVRIRRVTQAGCNAGGLEWQLFKGSADQGRGMASSMLLFHAADAQPLARPLRLAVQPGIHQVPVHAVAQLEDRVLFEQALDAGLIQPLADGRLALATADAARLPLLKALHRSANGEHVVAQLRIANQDRHWLALRLRPMPGEALPVSAEPTRWHLSAEGELTSWSAGLPAVAARLQATPARGYTSWTRVLPPAAWLLPVAAQVPQAASAPPPVRVALPVVAAATATAATQPRLQLLLLGRLLRVEGAQVISDEAACDGPGCDGPEAVRRLTLAVQPGAAELALVLADQPAFNRLNPAATEHRKVQWHGRRVAWVDEPAGDPTRAVASADVTVLADDGQALFAQGEPTPLARRLGLVPLVGLGPQHGRSLAGALARLGAAGQAQVVATTTIDPTYQASLQAVLTCQGQLGGRWLSDEQRCAPPERPSLPPDVRISAAVLLDAQGGGVLAAASGQEIPPGLGADELLAFDAFNPAHSPLAVPVFQHAGGPAQSPGSAFKVVDALMHEHLATSSGSLAAWLQGVPSGMLDAQARAAGLAFSAAAPCYPAPCDGRTKQIENYHGASATRYEEQGRFGLVQALRHSVNTWFAMLAEYTDRTVRVGHADARPLGIEALRSERPLLALSDELRLSQTLRLDGDLLPIGHHWIAGDALSASATTFDPLVDEHSVRQQALGLRMQTTPLQLARISAAVATGQVPPVHLLKQLNGAPAAPGAPIRLTMPLPRIRQGMHEVVRAGTAAGAFSLPTLQGVRNHVYGKTGTAPLGSRPQGAACDGNAAERDLPPYCLHNAWFIGYLLPGALPGESRTLAFAVQVSHTRQTGGAAAASVVAAWMADHWARHNATSSPALASR